MPLDVVQLNRCFFPSDPVGNLQLPRISKINTSKVRLLISFETCKRIINKFHQLAQGVTIFYITINIFLNMGL